MRLYNLARMTTATTGTGTITLGAAATSWLTFALAGVQDGETVTYAIVDGANREIGRGVYTASGTTLTRVVLKSTNSDAAISLSGAAEVFIMAAAEDLLGARLIAVSGTSRTIAVGDAGAYIRYADTGAKTCTFNTAANLISEQEFHVANRAASGDLTLGGTCTLNAPKGGTLVLAPGDTVTVKMFSASVADVIGSTVDA